MNRAIRFGLILLLFWGISVSNVEPVVAARGMPGSPDFGFGATIYTDAPNLKEALEAANDLELDWICVPVAWAVVQPDPTALNLGELDLVMQYANEHGLAVMVSLGQAPIWVQTPQGPDPTSVAQFVALLARRYPALLAVELWPGANTVRGWGSAPSASAYMNLFSTVSNKLRSSHPQLLLVAAGLQPLSDLAVTGDVDDLAFLQGLYENGAAAAVKVFSIQYPVLTGSLLSLPSSQEQRVFRHYEEIRRVMVENENVTGILWVTQFSMSSGTINLSDSDNQDQIESSWLSQAYVQLRAQLYVGAGFLQNLNSKPGEGAVPEISLLRGAGVMHSFYSILREMIALNQAGSAIPGKTDGG